MNRRHVYTTLSVAIVVCLSGVVKAQPAEDRRPKIGIAEVKIAPTLIESVRHEGHDKTTSLGRVVEAIDGRLIDRLHNTRKFRVISRSDLDAIFKEQNFALSGNVDTNDPAAAQSFAVAGVQYLVVTTVDDFQDFKEEATFKGTGRKATKRVVRLGAVAKLYDSTTGELLESASVQLGPGDPDYEKIRELTSVRNYTKTDGRLDDRLLVQCAVVMADRVANRIVDVLFPAKVIGKTGNQVLINRGDGTDIAVGEVWSIYALGEEMIDPDTGISLGVEEVLIGSVQITDVQPMFARSKIIGEDMGIAKAQILRRTE